MKKAAFTVPALLGVLFSTSPPAAAHRADASLEAASRLILRSWGEAPLDPGASQKALADWIRENPSSPLAEAAVRFLLRCRGVSPDPRLGADLVSSLLELEGLHGLAGRRLLSAAAADAAARGDLAKRRALLPSGKDPAHYLVLGPLGDFASDQHHSPLQPEKEGIRLDAAVQGVFGPVRWRSYTRPWYELYADPSARVPRDEGAWYALLQVESGNARSAWIYFRPTGSCVVRFNGRKVLDLHAPETVMPRRVFIPVRLEKGWNRVLVKTTETDSPRFALSFVDERGNPLEGLREEEGKVLHPLPGIESGPSPGPFLDGLASLSGEKGPWAALMAGILLSDQGFPSRALARIEEGRKSWKGKPEPLWSLLAAVRLLNARHLPSDYRRNRARTVFESLKDDPGAAGVQAGLFLANLLTADDKGEEAVRTLKGILAGHPRVFPARNILYQVYRSLSWRMEQEREGKALLEAAPKHPAFLLREASRLENLGNPAKAYELIRRACLADQGSASLLSRARRTALSLGRLGEAEQWLDKERALHPEDTSLLARAADLALDRGEPAKALDSIRTLERMEPGEPSWFEKEGDILLGMGKRAEALEAFKKSLALDPSQHDLRKRIALLEGRDWAARLASYRVDSRKVIQNFKMKPAFSESHSVLVVDHMVIQVHPDGSWIAEVHQIRRINDLQGVDDYGSISPQGEVVTLRSWAPDGTISEPISVGGEYQIPGLKPGCFIEEVSREDHAESLRAPWEISSFVYSSFDEPFLWSRLIVILPEKRRGGFAWGGGLPEPKIAKEGEEIVYTFQVKNRPRVIKESFMPGEKEVIPWSLYGEDRPTSESARTLRARLLPLYKPYEEIQKAVRKVCAGKKGDLAKAKAIYDFVQAHVHDVRGSSNPVSILLKGEGRRWFLLAAMFHAAGIPMELGFAHGAPPGADADPFPPFKNSETLSSWFQLPALLLEPRDGKPAWFFAGMPRYLPFGMVHSNLGGSTAILLREGALSVRFLPQVDMEKKAQFLAEGTIRLEPRGSATGRFTLTFPGPLGWQIKDLLKKIPESQRERFVRSQLVAPLFRGAFLRDFSASGLETPEALLRIHLTLHYGHFLLREGGRPAVPTGIFPARLAGLVRRPKRTWPFVFRSYSVQKWKITLDPGKAWVIRDWPESRMKIFRFLFWNLAFTMKDGKLQVERNLVLEPGRIPPSLYPRLITVCRSIDEAEARKVVLSPGKKR